MTSLIDLMLQKLPIGYSTLKKIIDQDCVYIDKTHHVVKLVDRGGYYFLARPRRFGKSLFIDTIKQAFLGNKELFNGLYIEKQWNWSKKYPVIHLSFGLSKSYNSEAGLIELIHTALDNIASDYGITLPNLEFNLKFNALIQSLSKQADSEVVVLIDEYDKPILDVIDNAEGWEMERITEQ